MKNTSSYSKFTDKTDKSFEDIIKHLDSEIGETVDEVHNEKLNTIFEGCTEVEKITISGNNYSYKVYK